jgi:pSer/pThr/pTyr-binding forkhead associated (FHA) protein
MASVNTSTIILIPLASKIPFHTRTLTCKQSKPVILGRDLGDPHTTPTLNNGYFTVDHENINSSHAQIWAGNGKIMIKDNGSRKGTFVNNTKLTDPTGRILHNGDIICLGPKGHSEYAVTAKVFVGIPTVLLRPDDGCTSDFAKEGKSISLSPGTKVTIGANLTTSKGSATVDKAHAQLWWENGDMFICDLSSSSNKTVVNGTTIKKGNTQHYRLKNGDIIRLGSHKVVKMDHQKLVGAAPIIVKVKVQ